MGNFYPLLDQDHPPDGHKQQVSGNRNGIAQSEKVVQQVSCDIAMQIGKDTRCLCKGGKKTIRSVLVVELHADGKGAAIGVFILECSTTRMKNTHLSISPCSVAYPELANTPKGRKCIPDGQDMVYTIYVLCDSCGLIFRLH